MAAVGLKSYILNNNIKSAVLLAGFPVLLVLLVYALELIAMGTGMLPRSGGGLSGDLALAFRMLAGGIPLAFAVAAIWFVIAYFFQSAIINGLTGAHGVSRQEAPQIYNLLENLAISRGMKTPTLHIIEDMSLNAFATGLHEGQYSVTLTRGIIERLNRDELEAVIGHELTHIINRDVRLMVICAVFAGIISLIGQLIFRITVYGGGGRSRDRDNKGGGILIVIGFVAIAVAYVLSIVLRFAISRQAEYLADAGSVELTKNPDAMIRALQKISYDPFVDAPEQLRGMFIEDPAQSLMATHPSIEKRIDALVKYAGGRVEPLDPSTMAMPEQGEVFPAREAEGFESWDSTDEDLYRDPRTDPSDGRWADEQRRKEEEAPARPGPWGRKKGPWG
jgi:heat shock protein HtpX